MIRPLTTPTDRSHIMKSDAKWHALRVEDVLRDLGSGPHGLSEDEAKRRLSEFGPNELRAGKRTTNLEIFLGQFKNIIVIILLISAAISGYIDVFIDGEPPVDTYVITAIVIMNAVLGFVQEYRAERAIEALKRLVAPTVRVIRGGRETSIPSKEVVPGDVLMLEAGERIPADSRLIETTGLKIDEAPLTGESMPVAKRSAAIQADAPVSDRANMAFMGTSVSYGRGKAVATVTGMRTEFGRIAEMVQSVREEEPPLKRRVEQLGKQLGLIALVLCAWIFALGLLFRYDVVFMFMTSVSMAVSAMPEGLPAVITITLALGVSKMARQRAIVRKLASVETLGCTTVICSDKTGTLTKNEMTVSKLYINGEELVITGTGYEPQGKFLRQGESFDPKGNYYLNSLLEMGSLCNNARLERDERGWRVIGDPTEGAILVAAAKAGIWQREAEERSPRIAELPFDSGRKRMSTIHAAPGGRGVAYVKGAPELLLGLCEQIDEGGRARALSQGDIARVLSVTRQFADEALRILAVAYKDVDAGLDQEAYTPEAIEGGLTFLGLIGMTDPPREEVPGAVRMCRQAGIRTVMVTGDHKLTAIAVAKEIGLMGDDEGDHKVLTGTEMDRMGDDEFDGAVDGVTVFARVSPEHKMRIAQALKRRGHVTAMTGDGVNDAPAVKAADIGIAMGIKGTDVTKEASDMVLEDDNFATIVTAVEGGRHLYDNIRKYIKLMVSANFDEFFEITTSALLGLPLPILPVQILWINLVTDGLPAVALSMDPKEPDIMQRPPRDPRQGILHGLWAFVLFSATVDFMSDYIPFTLFYLSTGDTARARTIAFTIVVIFEFLLAYNCRSDRHSIFGLGWKGLIANKVLFASVVAGLALQLAILYVPILQVPFHVVPLTPPELGLCIIGGCTALLILPGKLIGKRGQLHGVA